LGEIQGTPTIRLYKPKKKQRQEGSHSEKIVLDYRHGERTAKDLLAWVESEMPNYSTRVTFGKGDLEKAFSKAKKYGLPVAMIFTSKPKTSPLIKFLSTEFRRRLLLLEVPPTTNNQEILRVYGLEDKDKLPALLVIPSEQVGNDNAKEYAIEYDGDKFTRRKLQDFLHKHALKEPVYKPKDNVGMGTDKENKEAPLHTEF
jgi:protein disulfide-isomerase A6